MGQLLKQIVHNTEPKRSFSSVLSENKTRFKTWFETPIQLDKNKEYEITLINLETCYSFPNIDNSNNCFSPVLMHYGITLLFLKLVITLKI